MMKRLYVIAFLLFVIANGAKAQFHPRFGDTIQGINPSYYGSFDPTGWFAQDTIKRYWERKLVGWYTCDTIYDSILVHEVDGTTYMYYDTQYVQCPIHKWDSVYHRIHHDIMYDIDGLFIHIGERRYPVYPDMTVVGRHTSRPQKVIGIAGQVVMMLFDDTWGSDTTDNDYDSEMNLDTLEHFLLCEKVGPDSLLTRIDIPWRRFANDSSRFISTPLRPPVIICCARDSTIYRVLRYQETYLESPVFVTDSFFIGATTPHGYRYVENDRLYALEAYYGQIAATTNPHSTTCPRYNAMSADTCPPVFAMSVFHKNTRRTRTFEESGAPFNSWYRSRDYGEALPLIFPIVEDMCPEAEELQVMRSTPDSAFVTWRAAYSHTLWEVAYIKEGNPADSLIRDTVDYSHYELSGLDSNSNYIFQVKSFCPYHLEGRDSAIMGFSDSIYVSEWSDSLTLLFGAVFDNTIHETNTDTTGISDTTGVSISNTVVDPESVTLVPNPATNTVCVSSDQKIISIEIFNLQGQMVELLPIGGSKVQINTTRFDSGTYLLRIHTLRGIVSKKLIVI